MTDTVQAVKELSPVGETLAAILRSLCSRKEEVVVTEAAMTRSLTFGVTTSHKDFGRVIGSKARNLKAIELLVKLMAAKEDKEARISVTPPDNKSVAPNEKFRLNPKWGKKELQPIVSRICEAIFEHGGVVNIVEPDQST